MKTFLVSTDFSSGADHAVDYSYSLARQMQASLILCNAVVVPAEVPMASAMVWPMDECGTLLDCSNEELKKVKTRLEKNTHDAGGEGPAIRCVNEIGTMQSVVNALAKSEKADLVIIGAHGSKGLDQFILGNHCRIMIDATSRPLLMISPEVSFKKIKKIAFGTDFKNPSRDLQVLYKLIAFARPLDAEILLTHVCSSAAHTPEFESKIEQFMTELADTADYAQIYYRIVRNDHVRTGLEWLCKHGQVDILAMVHRTHSFFDNLLNGSTTQKMAGHLSVPLLVFPA